MWAFLEGFGLMLLVAGAAWGLTSLLFLAVWVIRAFKEGLFK